MSTGVIIAIVVGAILLIALFAFVLPRSREKARERQVVGSREEGAGAHREVTHPRLAEADRAEREARAQRAEAELHESRAALHEEGLADDDLAEEHRRFVRERDGDGVPDRDEVSETRRRGI